MNHCLSTGKLRAPAICASSLTASSVMLVTLLGLWLPEKTFGVGFWTAVATQPSDGIGLIMLLPDGTVLAEGSGANWWELAPDGNGHYVNGQWTQRLSSTWGHQTGSTEVLKDGNVFVAGGENGNGSGQVEIYHTGSGTWSTAVNPAYFGNIQDGNAMLMPNGRVLIEPQGASGSYSGLTFLFDPNNNTFSQTTGAPLSSNPGYVDGLGECSWVKLPNDNVLVIDSDQSSVGATTAEMYNPSTETWQNAVTGGTVPNIWPNMTGTGKVSEMGPAFLLPNGNAIFFGGNGVTAVYNNGYWSQSASLPSPLGQKDAPGAMMNNGKVLLAVSPQGVNSSVSDDNGIGPTSFYEYDYTANSGNGGFTLAPSPGGGISGRAEGLTLLDLPDGTVLLSPGGSQLYVYQPDGSPLAAGRPNINEVQWNPNGSLHLTGTLFNGISQGANYGDNEQMDSNWPIVEFSNGSGVYYGTTYNWSSTGVQTGGKVVTTEVNVPTAVLWYPGQWSLQVIANGIASPAVTFYSPVWVDFNLDSFFQFGYYDFPYYTLPQGVSAVSSGGTIAIRGDVQPSTGHETVPYTISTPMTIISVSGPSTIGN
ncbi:MAG TPA: hypothetical protein VNX46_07690 [Candidatus Acidoferrum sp.]|jgi:hypothetical protein|nr:hypothetical protein [Candidatus Acidoferrum sp.]